MVGYYVYGSATASEISRHRDTSSGGGRRRLTARHNLGPCCHYLCDTKKPFDRQYFRRNTARIAS